MTAETRKRRSYTDAFKRDAVALVTEQGYRVSEAARTLGINSNQLGRWKQAFAEEASGARLSADEREELKRLRKEVRTLRMEKEILKNRLRGLPRPMQSETRGATLSCVRTEAVSFLEALAPSKNLAQGKLRTRCWWRDSRPRLGM
jgi:transposase